MRFELPVSATSSHLEYIRILVQEETNMSELRYPNDSKEYRDARELLLKDEQKLVEKVKSVAERRLSHSATEFQVRIPGKKLSEPGLA